MSSISTLIFWETMPYVGHWNLMPLQLILAHGIFDTDKTTLDMITLYFQTKKEKDRNVQVLYIIHSQ